MTRALLRAFRTATSQITGSVSRSESFSAVMWLATCCGVIQRAFSRSILWIDLRENIGIPCPPGPYLLDRFWCSVEHLCREIRRRVEVAESIATLATSLRRAG